MKKSIAILCIGVIAVLIFSIATVEARKRAFNELYTKVSESVTYTAQVTRRHISEGKADDLKAKEKRLDTLRDKHMAKAIRAEEKRKAEIEAEKRRREANRQPSYPGGGHLTRNNGVYYFGNQRETYYNLPMDGVISIARSRGIGGEYWIRADGCKMLGDYIIIACNRSIHPYGSIVQTSLGLGISLDTGGFAYTHPYGVDIAVNW